MNPGSLFSRIPYRYPGGMKDKSHKGQRHKGCGLCDTEKRAGNGAMRRPAADRRKVEGARAQIEATELKRTRMPCDPNQRAMAVVDLATPAG